MNESIDIVLVADHEYFIPSIALINSLLSSSGKFKIHVIIPRDTTQEYRKLLKQYSDCPDFIKDESYDIMISEYQPSFLINRYCSFRSSFVGHQIDKSVVKPFSLVKIYLGSILPDLSRILYLDSDTIVRSLDGIEFSTDPITAVTESNTIETLLEVTAKKAFPKIFRNLDINNNIIKDSLNSPVFDTGVFLADLDQWRSLEIGSLSDSLLQLEIKYQDVLFSDPEKAILNLLFNGRYRDLDATWNCMYAGYMQPRDLRQNDLKIYFVEISEGFKILHWNGPSKPWHPRHWHRPYYSQFIEISAFSDTVPLYSNPFSQDLFAGLERENFLDSQDFDSKTMFYDVFLHWRMDRIVVIGPPMYQLPYLELKALINNSIWVPMTEYIDDQKNFVGFFELPDDLSEYSRSTSTPELLVRFYYGQDARYHTDNIIVRYQLTPRKSVVSATMVKNENPEAVIQWIDYHRNLGVEHFYVYDNNSDDFHGLVLKLRHYIDRGLVTLTRWPYRYGDNPLDGRFDLDKRFCQTGQMNQCLLRYGNADWMIFHDIDEYFFPMKAETGLLSILKKYSKFSVLRVNTIWFGRLPGQPDLDLDRSTVIDHYRHRAKELESLKLYRTKCIVQPSRTVLVHEHYPVHFEGELLEMRGEVLRINHYYCVSNKNRSDPKYSEVRDDTMDRFSIILKKVKIRRSLGAIKRKH